jgi:hypothetical protein
MPLFVLNCSMSCESNVDNNVSLDPWRGGGVLDGAPLLPVEVVDFVEVEGVGA